MQLNYALMEVAYKYTISIPMEGGRRDMKKVKHSSLTYTQNTK